MRRTSVNNKPLWVDIENSGTFRTTLGNWLDKNCKGRHYLFPDGVYFDLEIDSAFFILRWV